MKLKKMAIWIIVIGIGYFILSHHFILVNSTVKLLKKSDLTLNYTFFNAKGKTNKTILAIKVLRDDGIGELLVDVGRMTDDEFDRLMEIYYE
jgi:hypothetical protein